MTTLVCLLEEQSAKVMLDIILPKILPENITTQYIPFEGKQDLEKNIKIKLQHWQTPDTKFLIMRDQDSGNCKEIKQQLLQKIINSGKKDVSIVRIACHELESFYLGDLEAVKLGLKLNNTPSQNNSKYRNPDNLANAKQELRRITQQQYQTVSGSRAIAPFLKLDGTNKSSSFGFLLSGIGQLCAT